MARAQNVFTSTEEFKDAMGAYAQQKNISVSDLIRRCVAREIGYDLKQELVTDGRRKYGSIEERQREQSRKAREERQSVAKFLSALKHEQHVEAVQALRKSLEDKGIDLSDL